MSTRSGSQKASGRQSPTVGPRGKEGRNSNSLFSPNGAVKVDKLPFTLKDIKQVIPPSLLQASMGTSLYYLARDLIQVALAVWVTNGILSYLPVPEVDAATDSTTAFIKLLRALVWLAYWFVQGTTCFGIWVIAHECGHQAYFGNRKTLNDTVGFVLHTMLWAPYHPWRISHATHHRFTNNIERDTVFPPRRYAGNLWKVLEWCPPLAWPHMIGYMLFGWPVYILFGFEGNWYEGRFFTSHLDPSSPLFNSNDRKAVLVSDAGLLAILGAMWEAAQRFGWTSVWLWYLGPVVVNYCWLVTITFLQHTDKSVPHYLDEEWDFLKGALCTVDRDYGIFNNWMHHITDGHVMHHVVSTMPFYNSLRATELAKPILGEYYRYDSRPLWKQLWESWFAHQASFLDNPYYLEPNRKRGKIGPTLSSPTSS